MPYLRALDHLARTIRSWEQPTNDQIIRVWDRAINDTPLHDKIYLIIVRLATSRHNGFTTILASCKKLVKADSSVKFGRVCRMGSWG
jgi:hypothetical protein